MLSISELCLFSFNWNHLLYCLYYKLWVGKCGKTRNLFHCVVYSQWEIDCARYSVVVLLDWLVFCVLCWGSYLVYNTFHVLFANNKANFCNTSSIMYNSKMLFGMVARSVKDVIFTQTLKPYSLFELRMFGEIPNTNRNVFIDE